MYLQTAAWCNINTGHRSQQVAQLTQQRGAKIQEAAACLPAGTGHQSRSSPCAEPEAGSCYCRRGQSAGRRGGYAGGSVGAEQGTVIPRCEQNLLTAKE